MKRKFPTSRAAALGAAALALLGPAARAQVDATNWGSVTTPVYGVAQTGTYAGADLFAGPDQFGSYFAGVLPDGKKVTPAGAVAQIGMNPLGVAVTPDGKYIITTNDDERNNGPSPHSGLAGGYTVSVVDASTLNVVSHVSTVGKLFIGLQVVAKAGGGYTVYASGGADQNVKVLNVDAGGILTVGTPIAIAPITPQNAGFASNYVLSPSFNAAVNSQANNKVPPSTVSYPTNGGNTGPGNFAPALPGGGNGSQVVFPAGSALHGRFLYVACNGDNSLAVIDTSTNAVIRRLPVGYFPYGVTVSRDGTKVLVSNWGIQQYSFLGPSYDGSGKLTGLTGIAPGQDVSGLFFVPQTSTTGTNPHTSSVSVISVPGGDPSAAAPTVLGSIYEGHPLDDRDNVGDTHPSATVLVRRGFLEVEYVAKANSDSLGLILVSNNRKLGDMDLSPLSINTNGHVVHGSYPNALAVSPDNTRLYVAEAGLNSVAVLDVSNPTQPQLLGRIPTGWYPTGVTVDPSGQNLYITNAKGVGEDINPLINNGVGANSNPTATGVESATNSNTIFGTLQQVPVSSLTPAALAAGNTTVQNNNYAQQTGAALAALDTSVVPLGGAASTKIKHVFFILHENKTFDSVLGNQSAHFGPYASLTFNDANGATDSVSKEDKTLGAGLEYTQLSLNTQALALAFATGVNYFSDSEESDAGHQFSASGTASDYTEKTLLVKTGRGLLVNKNFEPEDYPEGGYIFNNAARNGVSFKDYGALIRVDGTTNGTSFPSTTDDPASGKNGYSTFSGDAANPSAVVNGVNEVTGSDVSSPTVGLGQTYFLKNPILAILGENNGNGEPHIDRNYPGYNFDISDQRRAREFIADFDRMAAAGTLPTYLYIYQPNDHQGTGPNAIASPNVPGATGPEEISDGDTGLGMVVQHLMNSPVYYDAATGTGSAIFMTYDDAQSGRDHVDPHRTPLVVISPFARPGYVATHHYSTASIVKTEELLMGLPPNNYGDLFATDLRDLFQPTYNGITAGMIAFNNANTGHVYVATAAGRKVWKLAARLDIVRPGPRQPPPEPDRPALDARRHPLPRGGPQGPPERAPVQGHAGAHLPDRRADRPHRRPQRRHRRLIVTASAPSHSGTGRFLFRLSARASRQAAQEGGRGDPARHLPYPPPCRAHLPDASPTHHGPCPRVLNQNLTRC